MDIIYSTQASATAGRNGKAATSDGRLNVTLTHPVQPNRPPEGTDPEQLFACAYAACFGGAVEYAAKTLGAELTAPVQVDSRVSLGKLPESELGGGGFMRFGIAVELVVHLQGVDDAQGQQIVERAHQICPYSNATRGQVAVDITVVAVPAAA